jgi:hypothetical protein
MAVHVIVCNVKGLAMDEKEIAKQVQDVLDDIVETIELCEYVEEFIHG